MALRKTLSVDGTLIIQSESGLAVAGGKKQTAKDFYIKVIEVSGDQKAATARVQFSSDDAYAFTKTYGFQTDINGSKFVAQAYEHIKTLPEFVGALDC